MSPLDLRLGNPGPAHERTDTHTRCSGCREWKKNHEFRPKTRTCRDCHRLKVNRRYATMSEEELVVVRERTRKNQSDKRKAARMQRYEDCQFILGMLRDRGMSYRDIEQYTGVSHGQALLAVHGRSKYVKCCTHRKLREAWDRLQEEEARANRLGRNAAKGARPDVPGQARDT